MTPTARRLDALPATPDRALLTQLPLHYARRQLILPIERGEHGITVAVAGLDDTAPIDDLRHLYGEPIVPVVVSAAVLRDEIPRAYDRASNATADALEAIESASLEEVRAELAEPPDLLENADGAPVIRLLNALLTEAVGAGASDVHVEPFEQRLIVRLRVDGVLSDVLEPPIRLHAALVARAKIMANLDIGERRLPQDGRFAVRVGDRRVDVRLSLVPTAFGERMVLRVLDHEVGDDDFGALGLGTDTARALEDLLGASHGIVLVTGPTGSGKTTTLYTALRRIATGERNVMTIEDPIEYQLDGVAQMQVNPRIGLDFATGLRAVLRQDPDVILVGEIRDRETVEIALRAALTGHLVFATLHTNDAASAVTRLLDMGVEPYLIASSVRAILAQRLVRRRCEACDARGCARCRGTGLRGRTAIHELLPMTAAVRALVMARADADTVERTGVDAGMVRMRDDGLAKAAKGATTTSEVVRVTREQV